MNTSKFEIYFEYLLHNFIDTFDYENKIFK